MRKLILTGLGTGHLPIAPGTWASAAATAVFLLVAWLTGGSAPAVGAAMAATAVLASAACVGWGGLAETAFGRKDPSECTVDEWAGQAVALLLLPLRQALSELLVVAAVSFLAFRAFDILKPPPARGIQKLPAGWGILADDLIAGVYANLAAQLILRWGLGW